jgi:hypothetical protein
MEEKARTDGEREKTYAEHVDFYRLSSQVIVVNGGVRPMNMRLVLRGHKVWWDLGALRPCTQIAVPNDALFESMTRKTPGLRLSPEDLAGLLLEFRDPRGRSWIRTSGNPVSRSKWRPESSEAVLLVNSEVWNHRPEDSPECG